MRSNLQNFLYEKYPALFRQKDLPMSETCMCWGINCGDGWYGLVNRTCAKIQAYCEEQKIKVEFVQVKQKFGGLRIYFDMVGDYLDYHQNSVQEIVTDAEKASFNTCEVCGSTEGVRIDDSTGWLQPMCYFCDTKGNHKQNFGKYRYTD